MRTKVQTYSFGKRNLFLLTTHFHTSQKPQKLKFTNISLISNLFYYIGKYMKLLFYNVISYNLNVFGNVIVDEALIIFTNIDENNCLNE